MGNAFYDILKAVAKKYEFEYPNDKMIELSKRIKVIVDDKTRYTDCYTRDDIKANLKVDLILLLDKFRYPPVTLYDVYKGYWNRLKTLRSIIKEEVMDNTMNRYSGVNLLDKIDSTDIDLEMETESEIDINEDDKRKLYVDKVDKSTSDLFRMIVEGELNLQPDYQRRFVWDKKTMSKFIESLLLSIPIPTIFLAENNDDTFEVIDGQQRLTTIFAFMKSKLVGNEIEKLSENLQELDVLTLSGLETLKQFNKNIVDDEIIVAKVCEQIIIGVHGHKDNYNRAIDNLALFTKQIPNYIVMGHFHHSREADLKGVEMIVNPSLCGSDRYAVDGRKFSKAGQKLLMLNKDEGRYATYFISFK